MIAQKNGLEVGYFKTGILRPLYVSCFPGSLGSRKPGPTQKMIQGTLDGN